MVCCVLVLQTLSSLATLLLPSLNADIIDNGVAAGDLGYIWSTGVVMAAVALVQGVTAVAATWCAARTAMGVGRDLRRAVYTRVDSFAAQDMGSFGVPTLITRGTNDVQQVAMLLVMTLSFMVTMPVMCVGGVVMALREDAGLSWLVWVCVPILIAVMAVLVAQLMPLFQAMQLRTDDINGVLREQITGIRVIRAFVREDHETARFGTANQAIGRVAEGVGRVFVLMGPVTMVIMHGAVAAVLWFGGQRVDAGAVEVGSLTAFMQYLLQILAAVMMGTFMMMMLPRAVVCARRIEEVLRHEPSIMPPASPRECGKPRGELEFRGVSFTYPGADHPVLQDISFRVSPGQTTAIVGATGSGKTTLVNLIPRLIAPTSGTVLLDGVPVEELARGDIVNRVALVPQKPYLFSGTVAYNLRFGDAHATDQELWEALRVAQAEGFVAERVTGSGPERACGLESTLAQGGTDVSGGQRQRLCIARALVSRASVYLFDDSFSALDVATDAKVRAALKPRLKHAAVLTVAQRVSTIQDADQILVLEAGRIVARGTHADLLEESATYREIVASQYAADAEGER